MGGEWGEWNEWDCKEELHWDLLKRPLHQKLQRCVAHVNHLYLKHPALWEDDFSHGGWKWVDHRDEKNLVISYLRKGRQETLLCVHHFGVEVLWDYLIPHKGVLIAEEIFTTDSQEYGGCGIMNPNISIEKGGVRLTVPPLSTLIIKV